MFRLSRNRICALNVAFLQMAEITTKTPVITVPATVQQALKKHKARLLKKDKLKLVKKSRAGNENIPIVMCKREMFNYYKDQTYGKLEAVPLTTQGWLNRKSVGDYFIIHGHTGNPAFNNDDDDDVKYQRKSFGDIGIASPLLQSLNELGFEFLTDIQRLVIPHILKGRNVLCSSETGSGKTLAYLLPIIQQIVQCDMPNRDFNSPTAIILTPGRELAEQIGSVTEQLIRKLDLTCKVLIGGLGTKKLVSKPVLENTDIIVSSLGVFKKLVSNQIYRLDNIRHVVVDEADSLLDDSFSHPLLHLFKKINFGGTTNVAANVQLCLVGATIPRNLDVILQPIIDIASLHKVSTSHLHRLMPHVPQKFIRLKLSQKTAELLKLVKLDVAKNKPVMIFSKNSPTCDFVSMFLNENGVNCINLHGDMNANLRVGRFMKFQEGLVNVMSCTDLGSRGLDTLRVRHVINYDFPSFMSDYIHRAGRTGRVGSGGTGHVTNFIAYPHEVNMAQKIEMSAKKMESLPNVNANIKRKLESRHDFL